MAIKNEPGRDPQMVERTQKLNVVFALTSIGLLVTFSLMVWADYARDWKRYQKQFTDMEATLTKKQIEEALGKVDAARRAELESKLAQGNQEMAARRSEVKKAEGEVEKLEGEWYRVDQDYRFTKAEIDVARYEYEEAARHGAGSTPRKKAHLDELETKWQGLRLQLEDVERRRAEARARVAELEKTRREAEKTQTELFAEKTRLEDKLKSIERGVVWFVRNLPILDLANPSLKVNQIMPANLYDDVIFTGTPKVDRCTTCHVGIDKKGYETAPQPFATHPDMDTYLRGAHPIEKIGCTACHQGRGRATGFQAAAHIPSTKEQEKAWGKYTGSDTYHPLHYWDLPMTARGHTESQCQKCHQGVVEVPKAERLNTGTFLLEKYGCYGCHKIKGWEGLRKLGPDLTKIASKTTDEWIYRWIKEPKAFRPTQMPQVWDVRIDETAEQKARNDVEANAAVAYLFEKSGRDAYPPPPAGDLQAGRKTFETVGCLACHRIGNDRRGIDTAMPDGTVQKGLDAAAFRTHGPNLDGTGSKVDAGWLYSWVRDPKGYWHETRMPNLRLTEKEAADVTAYLMSLRHDDFMARPRPALDTKLRDTIVREYLVAQFPTRQADEKLGSMDDHAKTLFLGERTIGRYGCFGCHTITGFEKTSPIGVELTEEGSKLVERLDFGFEHENIPHTLPAWLHLKVKEPRIYDRGKSKKPEELLRMPKFWVSDEEADAIVTAVLSLTKEQIPLAAQKQLSADARYVEKGRRLVRNFNCQGCHQIGEKGGNIKAVVASQLEAAGVDSLSIPSVAMALSPPLLYNAAAKIGEGSRVQTPWLHDFLKDPSRKIRPWMELRMPTFEFSEDELNTLTRYFAAQDDVTYPYDPKPTLDPTMVATGHDLFNKWQCIKCHVVAGKLPDQDPSNMAPDLSDVPTRLRADWLSKWLADPGHIQPGTKMPANFPANPEENAFPEILGGDQKLQIEAVRSYLLTLGPGGLQTRPGASSVPHAGAAPLRSGTVERTSATP
jgi:cytochrome c2